MRAKGPRTVIANAAIELEADGGDDDRAECWIEIDGVAGPGHDQDIPDTSGVSFNRTTMSLSAAAEVPAGRTTSVLLCQEDSGAVKVVDTGIWAVGLGGSGLQRCSPRVLALPLQSPGRGQA